MARCLWSTLPFLFASDAESGEVHLAGGPSPGARSPTLSHANWPWGSHLPGPSTALEIAASNRQIAFLSYRYDSKLYQLFGHPSNNRVHRAESFHDAGQTPAATSESACNNADPAGHHDGYDHNLDDVAVHDVAKLR
jgi:hypothetical protein